MQTGERPTEKESAEQLGWTELHKESLRPVFGMMIKQSADIEICLWVGVRRMLFQCPLNQSLAQLTPQQFLSHLALKRALLHVPLNQSLPHVPLNQPPP